MAVHRRAGTGPGRTPGWALKTAGLASLAALTLVAAACSSSSSTSTSTANASASASSTASSVALSQSSTVAVTDAAKKVAASRPTGVKLPKETIGLVNVLYESETAQRIQAGFVAAAKMLGWTVDAVDAGGDPTKSAADMASFINQKVNAIIDLSNATESISAQLAQARKAGIPVVNIGGLQDSNPNLLAQYVNNDAAMAQELAAYMLTKLPAKATVAMDEAPILKSERVRDSITSAALNTKGATLVTHDVNLANLVSDVQTATNAQIEANPNLSAIWTDIDSEVPVIAQVLKTRGLCGKIQVYGFYDDQPSLQYMRENCVTALVTEPGGLTGYVAADQLAQYFARHVAVAPSLAPLNAQWGIHLEDGPSTRIIDSANIPPAGQYAPPYYDYTSFFQTVWTSEFGKLPG